MATHDEETREMALFIVAFFESITGMLCAIEHAAQPGHSTEGYRYHSKHKPGTWMPTVNHPLIQLDEDNHRRVQ